MANAYYGINLGQNEIDIVESSSTNSTDIELNVNLSTVSVSHKEDVLLALDKLKNYITKDSDNIWG